jgi:lysophospholipase L1-like esterase
MKHFAATVAFGPFFFLQGHYVRRVTPVLPEPPGARAGTQGSGPPLRLLVLGDSAAAGVGAPTQDQGLAGRLVASLSPHFCVSWKLIARTGATTSQTLRHLARVDNQPFDVIVTSLGVNDLTTGYQRWAWLQRQAELIEVLKDKFAARLILLSGLPPMHLFPALPQPLRWYMGAGARHFNAGLHGLVQARDDCHVFSIEVSRRMDEMARESFAADGFHPGPVFYAAWAEHLAEQIVKRLATQAAARAHPRS